MSEHSHVAKVLSWKLDEKTNHVPAKYGCTGCDMEFFEPPKNQFSKEHTHTEYVDGCFTCKIETLQLATGDANGALVANGWSNKKWDNEMNLYAKARAQGIQPDGTSSAKVRAALDASDKVGVAYGT